MPPYTIEFLSLHSYPSTSIPLVHFNISCLVHFPFTMVFHGTNVVSVFDTSTLIHLYKFHPTAHRTTVPVCLWCTAPRCQTTLFIGTSEGYCSFIPLSATIVSSPLWSICTSLHQSVAVIGHSHSVPTRHHSL